MLALRRLLLGRRCNRRATSVDMVRHRKLAQMGPTFNLFLDRCTFPTPGGRWRQLSRFTAGIYNVVDDEPVRFVEYVRRWSARPAHRKRDSSAGIRRTLGFGEVWNYFTRSLASLERETEAELFVETSGAERT